MAILVLNSMEILASSGVFGHIELIDIEKGDFHTAIGKAKGNSTTGVYVVPPDKRDLARCYFFYEVRTCYLRIGINPYFFYDFEHRLHFGFSRRVKIFTHFKIGIDIVIGNYNVVRLLEIVVDIGI